jgi:hypothetical protein
MLPIEMRAGAIWGLSLGLLSAASSVRAAPPEGPLEPADAPLVRYDEAPIGVEPARPIGPERAPHTGVGRIVSGSLMLLGGGGLLSLAGVMVGTPPDHSGECDPSVDTGGDCRSGSLDGLVVLFAIPVFISGAGLLASGGVVLGTGIADQRRYRLWERRQDDRPVPPRGDGMLGSGVMLLCAGVTAGALTVNFADNHFEDPRAGAALTTSIAVTLGGVGLVIGSRFLRRKHMRWQNARMTPSLSPLPGTRSGIGGLSFGIAGRF